MGNKISGEFLSLLQELEAIEFIGLSKLLGVKLLDEKEPRDFYVLLHDCLERFEQLSRKKRKEILKILKEAEKEKNKDIKRNKYENNKENKENKENNKINNKNDEATAHE